MPQIELSRFYIDGGFFWAWTFGWSGAKKNALAVARKGDVPFRADLPSRTEAFGCRRNPLLSFCIPSAPTQKLGSVFLFGGQRQQSLFLVPGEFGVFPFAYGQCSWRIFVCPVYKVEAVAFLLLGVHCIDHQLAVFTQ